MNVLWGLLIFWAGVAVGQGITYWQIGRFK